MALIQGGNQSPRITTNQINAKGRTGDPSPGVLVSTSQVSGSIVQPYAGMVGGKLTLTQIEGFELGDPNVGTVYGGVYMYVQFAVGMTSTPARGAVCMWVDPTQPSPACYLVTMDGTPARANLPAGIAVNATTAGNWDFIQIAGIAQVKWPNGIQVATPAVGDAIFISSNITSPQLADDRDGTTVSTTLLKQFLGVAVGTPPKSNTVSGVLLDSSRWIY